MKIRIKQFFQSSVSSLEKNVTFIKSLRLLFSDSRSYSCVDFATGWLWGDPHIVTLDGQNYTFNGLGEYTMVKLQDGSFQLQARTKLAKGGGSATIFVAAVAKEKDTSAVQVNLKDEGKLKKKKRYPGRFIVITKSTAF